MQIRVAGNGQSGPFPESLRENLPGTRDGNFKRGTGGTRRSSLRALHLHVHFRADDRVAHRLIVRRTIYRTEIFLQWTDAIARSVHSEDE